MKIEKRILQAVSGDTENAIRNLGQNEVDTIYMLLSIASDYKIKRANEKLVDIINAYRIPDEEIMSYNQELCKMYLLGEHIEKDFYKASKYFDDLEENVDLIKIITKNLQGEELKRFKYFFDEDFIKSIKFNDDLFSDLIITKNRIVHSAINPNNHIRKYVIIGVPCFSIIIQYDVPLWQNSKAIAEIINKYVNFIPDNVLNTTLSARGTYKKFTQNAFNRGQKKLIEIYPNEKRCHEKIYCGNLENPYDVAGYFFAELSARIGDPENYSPSDKNNNNQLILGFPISYINNLGLSALEDFYKSILTECEVNSSYVGYYLAKGCSLQGITWKDIDPLKVSDKYDYFMLDVTNGWDDRNKISQISWLNYYGKSITKTLGGINSLKESLPKNTEVEQFLDGVLIKTSETPLYGSKQVNEDGYKSLLKCIHKYYPDLLETYLLKKRVLPNIKLK